VIISLILNQEVDIAKMMVRHRSDKVNCGQGWRIWNTVFLSHLSLAIFPFLDHMAQIVELVGSVPKQLSSSGKYSNEIFNRKGELRHIHKLRHWRLSDVLHDKYHLSRHGADFLSSFLTPMLDLNSEKRVAAGVMVGHPWLAEIKLQHDKSDGLEETLVMMEAPRPWEVWEKRLEQKREEERQTALAKEYEREEANKARRADMIAAAQEKHRQAQASSKGSDE
jgi:hypothetical protein